jgi:hypothetical protein
LAALGLDRLLEAAWPQVWLAAAAHSPAPWHVRLDSRWLLAIPLVFALLDVWRMGARWITTYRVGPEVSQVLDALSTPDLQWVNEPYGEHFYTELAVRRGLKLADDFRTWRWKGRPFPEPVLEARRGGAPPEMTQRASVGDVAIYAAPPGREYATVAHPDGGRTVCAARGAGGNIDVTCSASEGGTLTVKENSWSGWRASVDGRSVPLGPGRWLAVELPAGSHTIVFRYRPWDVPLGLVLGLAGLALAAYSWRKGGSGRPRDGDVREPDGQAQAPL